MNASASAVRTSRSFDFWSAPIGKKMVMAVTGVVLFGFVVGHLLGNLQVFLGPEQLNAYARFLHDRPGLVWTTRIVLLIALIFHVVSAIQIAQLRRRARPQAYQKWKAAGSDYASRTMLRSGLIVLAFVIYHLLHFTFGTVHPSFVEHDVYSNIVIGFQQPIVAIAYIVAMLLLGTHLYHGLWSLFQSLGLLSPRLAPKIKRAAAIITSVIVAGELSIPTAVLLGIVR